MGRLTKACLAVALVSPVFVMLANAEQPSCIESVPPETTTTTTSPATTTTLAESTPSPTTTLVDSSTSVPESVTTTTVVESVTTTTVVESTTTTTINENELAVQSSNVSSSATSAPVDSSPADLPTVKSFNPLQPLFNPSPEDMSTTAETLPKHLDPDCPPVVELLDFPGWGTHLDFLNDAGVNEANGAFDVVRVSTAGIALTQSPVIQPAYPRSTDIYTVSAQISVTSPVTLEALKDVTMCWVKTDEIAAGKASSDCSTLDPRYNFKMTWSEANAASATGDDVGIAGFAVVRDETFGKTKYRNARSQVETTEGVASYDNSVQSMKIKFNFRVSSAMTAGEQKWSVSLTAAYDTDASPTVVTAENLSVGYFSSISIDKELVDFGAVAPGATKPSQQLKLGAYRANSESELVLRGTDYVCAENACSSALLLVNNPESNAVGTVVLECRPKDGSPITLTTSNTPILVIPATGELEEELTSFSCTLSYGGGAERTVKHLGPISLDIRQALGL